MRGWLLDLHPSGEDQVCIWLRLGEKHVANHRVRWTPKIYVSGPPERLAELAKRLPRRYELHVDLKSVSLGGEPDTVLEVRVPFGRKKTLAKEILDDGGYRDYRVYNVDLPTMQEFLYEHNLFPTAYVELSGDEIRALDSVEDLDYTLHWMRAGHLSVRVRPRGAVPRLDDPLEEVRITFGGEEVVLDGCEDSILEGLSGLLDDLDLDVVITEGGDSFVIPYLHYRARLRQVELRLGRAEDPGRIRPRSTSYVSYGKVHHRFSGIKLRGRIHIDSSNSMLYGEVGLEGLVEVARTARIPLQDAARYSIGTCMTSLQYYQAHRLGVLLPWRFSRPIYMTAGKLSRADRGGLILDARPGIFWNVGEIDFKSLYPMLMYRYNISGETVNCGCCAGDGIRIPEIGYHVCKRFTGIIPRAIELPLKKRLEYKRLLEEVRDPEQRRIIKRRIDALKWILVTAFGYLGFRKAKFGSREAHMAVCALARDVLLKAIKIAEDMGFEVVHGIVDSIWVYREYACDEDYVELAGKIERELELPVSYEGRYRWIVFLPSKNNPEKPVNNRYFGVFTDGRVKIRGLEARRRDMPKIVKEMQYEMISRLAEAESPEELREKILECLEVYRKYVRKVILGTVSEEDLAISRRISMDPLEYSHTTRQSEAARRLRSLGVAVEPGQSIVYVLARPATPIQLYDGSYSSREYLRLLENAFRTMAWFFDRFLNSWAEGGSSSFAGPRVSGKGLRASRRSTASDTSMRGLLRLR